MIEKLISVFIMIVLFYMSIGSITEFSKLDYDKISLLIKEFNLGYIEDIQIKEIPSICDINYSPIDFDFDYSGNYKGCQCINKSNRSKIDSFLDKCPDNRDECTFFKERNEKEILYWRSKLICIKRSDLSLKDFSLVANSSVKCKDDFKSCGRIDTLGNYLCIHKNNTCPVSNLGILHDPRDVIELNKTVNNKTSFLYNLNNYSYLKFNVQDPNPNLTSPRIFNLFNAGKSGPCLFSDRYPKGDLIFELMKNYNNFGCNFDTGVIFNDTTDSLDNRYIEFDSYPLGNLLSDNGLKDLVIELSKVSQDKVKENIILSGREFVGWNLGCRFYENGLNSFLNVQDLLNKILLANITHCFIMILFLLAIAISSCFFTNYFEVLFRIICILFCILNLIYPIQIISKTNFVVNTVVDENGDYCSDNDVNRILKIISTGCYNLNFSYIKTLLISILYTLIIIYGLYKWIKPYHEQYQDTYKKYIERK